MSQEPKKERWDYTNMLAVVTEAQGEILRLALLCDGKVVEIKHYDLENNEFGSLWLDMRSMVEWPRCYVGRLDPVTKPSQEYAFDTRSARVVATITNSGSITLHIHRMGEKARRAFLR